MNYVLDTNILLFYLRDSHTKAFIDQQYNPFSASNNPIISIVTVGEIKSIARQNQWGGKRLQAVEDLLGSCIITDIKYEPILEKYAEIDAFSQGRIRAEPLGRSARNMGKNDLWIAATTVVANAQLLTSDHDFDHLHQKYFEVIKIERVKI
ncbi:MAG: PIN domain-containing protein [Saprospiraceae bacterium]